MLINKTKEEIRKYVRTECVTLQELRKETIALVTEVFGKIVFPNLDKLDAFGRDLEKLMAISLDLGESTYHNLLNGNLVAACLILRGQVIISQQAFVFSKNEQLYENWKSGKNPTESKLRNFVKKYEAQGKTPKYDPSEDTYRFYSDVFHMNYEKLYSSYVLSTLQDLDDRAKSDIQLLFFESLKYTARILRDSLTYLTSQNLIKRPQHDQLILRWNELDKRLVVFKRILDSDRKKIQELLSEK